MAPVRKNAAQDQVQGESGAWTIRAERPEDAALVDALNAASFGPGRFARAAFRLREGVHPEKGLSFVAVEGPELRGSVRFWPVIVGETPALMLGPLAVQSDQRGRGIGIALMERGLSEAKARGHKFAILVGDIPYYARVGFKQVPFAQHSDNEGKKTPPSSRVRFPGPVDPMRVLAIALDDSVSLDQLEGDVKRARIDEAVCTDGAALG
jgi:predicted N-acetyltransferase YhbS